MRLDSVSCIRSFGSSSRGTIARCHALGKAMQLGMGREKGFYVIEVLSRRFDKLSDAEKIKVLIHELMHIPKSFGGGFRHHDYVCEKNIEIEYQRYLTLLGKKEFLQEFLADSVEDSFAVVEDSVISEPVVERVVREKKRWFW